MGGAGGYVGEKQAKGGRCSQNKSRGANHDWEEIVAMTTLIKLSTQVDGVFLKLDIHLCMNNMLDHYIQISTGFEYHSNMHGQSGVHNLK